MKISKKGCQTAKRAFTEVDAEFRKLGYGTGRVNANMQPKLTQFMRVKYVPTLVVVYEEEIYHYSNFDQVNFNFILLQLPGVEN